MDECSNHKCVFQCRWYAYGSIIYPKAQHELGADIFHFIGPVAGWTQDSCKAIALTL